MKQYYNGVADWFDDALLERKVKVNCPKCYLTFEEIRVKIVNIESDVYERDVVTFICPVCHGQVKSLRVL